MLNDYSCLKSRPDVTLLETVDSTNNYIRRLIDEADSSTRSLTVISDRQTGGRGRHGRSFYSPESTGIYISYAFRAELTDPGFKHVTPYAAAIAHKVLSPISATPLRIKWVNDLYNDSGKTTGILTELITSASGTWIIVGTGINLLPPHSEDPSLKNVMGSIIHSTASSGCPGGLPANTSEAAPGGLALPTRGEVASLLIDEYDRTWSAGTSVRADLRHIYETNCMSLGKDLEVRPAGDSPYAAHSIGLTSDFELIVERSQDRARLILSSGEVSVSL